MHNLWALSKPSNIVFMKAVDRLPKAKTLYMWFYFHIALSWLCLMPSIHKSSEHENYPAPRKAELKRVPHDFRVSQQPSYLEIKGDSCCWVLWNEALQGGGDSSSAEYPCFDLQSSAWTTVAVRAQLLDRPFLLNSTSKGNDNTLKQIGCQASALFHSPSFYSVPFYAIIFNY